MELIEEKQNSLLNRKELKLNISELESLPSMDAARKMVSEKFSVPEEHIHIDKIAGKFGSKGFTVVANIYNSGSERERFHVIKRKQKTEGAK